MPSRLLTAIARAKQVQLPPTQTRLTLIKFKSRIKVFEREKPYMRVCGLNWVFIYINIYIQDILFPFLRNHLTHHFRTDAARSHFTQIVFLESTCTTICLLVVASSSATQRDHNQGIYIRTAALMIMMNEENWKKLVHIFTI